MILLVKEYKGSIAGNTNVSFRFNETYKLLDHVLMNGK